MRWLALTAAVWLGACAGDEAGDDCVPGDGSGVWFDADGPPCERLSSYRLFADGPGQIPNDGVVAYHLRSPLFSDYSDKRRFVWLPPGTTMSYRAEGALEFPSGAVIVKTFSYPEQLLETRLLVHTTSGWRGYTYVWNDDQSEALYTIPGAVIATGRGDYAVPNLNECKQCHQVDGERSVPIGPKARHINVGDQLATLVDAGLLSATGDELANAPQAPVWDDPATGSVAERARAYLDINCAHCHNPAGRAGATEIDLRASQTNPWSLGVCKNPTAAGLGSGGRDYAIAPGDPDASFMIYRLESDISNIRMPELGRRLVHTEGVALIREWISGMAGACETP